MLRSKPSRGRGALTSLRERLHRRGILGLIAAFALIGATTGCGGEGAGAAATEVPPVPTDCLQSWNAESASLAFGRHLAGTHRAKQAQVRVVKPEGHSINIRGKSTCAVIFAVEPNDYEYGTLGLVVTSFGWASMSELARGDPGRLKELQAEANEAPNVNLFPDGSLQPV